MPRVTRIAIAAVLALAVAALPLMLDRCAESCDAHQSARAATPACHHATTTGTHVTTAPTSCGHDHNGSAVTAVKSFAPTGRTFDFVIATGSQPSLLPPAATELRFDPHSPPDASPALAGRSLPLRV
jgi:hypothetical protein